MPKRFRDTNIWNHDWYIELPIEYKLFWQYVLDDCDCAGIWKPNLKRFEFVARTKIELEEFLNNINSDKERLVPLQNGNILIPGFIHFQYGNTLIPERNNAHKGIVKCLNNNEVKLGSLWGQIEVKESPKDKEKEKDTEREKDIDTDKESDTNSLKHISPNSFNSKEERQNFKRDDLSQKVFGKNFNELNETQKKQI